METARVKLQGHGYDGSGARGGGQPARVFANSGARPTSSGGGGNKKSSEQCPNCGSKKHTKKEQCSVYAKALVCRKCGKKGHIKKMCRMGGNSQSSSNASKKGKPSDDKSTQSSK